MKILVCIKQVPARSVPMDQTNGLLDRSKAGGKQNPNDSFAIEAALQIAEQTGGKVTALTMGPPSAETVLKDALSLGCAEAVLLSDKAFAGADVYATAFTLAEGIHVLGTFDVIVCGQQSTDGDTAQLPFSLGWQLGIPTIGWIKSLDMISADSITVSQELSFGTQQVRVKTPCLLSVGAGIGRVRMPSLRDKLKANSKEIRVLSLTDLEEKNATHYGLAASPTRVLKVQEIEHKGKAELLTLSLDDAAERILAARRDAKEAAK